MGRKKRASPRGQLEVSVEEAAHLLGVSSRMINNYISDKKLRAVKVSGQWFIDSVSVDALGQSYGFKPSGVEVKVEAESIKPKASNSTTSKNQKGPVRLAVYRLAQEGFSMAGWEVLASVLPSPYLEAVSLNQRKIYEYLGAGYYSWGGLKISCYLRARGAVGGILGILYSKKEFIDRMGPETAFLEKRLLPAFQSLLIRLNSRQSYSPYAPPP